MADYFNRPIQGNGRDSANYGRTVLTPKKEGWGGDISSWFSLRSLAVIAFAALVSFFVWQFFIR